MQALCGGADGIYRIWIGPAKIIPPRNEKSFVFSELITMEPIDSKTGNIYNLSNQ